MGKGDHFHDTTNKKLHGSNPNRSRAAVSKKADGHITRRGFTLKSALWRQRWGLLRRAKLIFRLGNLAISGLIRVPSGMRSLLRLRVEKQNQIAWPWRKFIKKISQTFMIILEISQWWIRKLVPFFWSTKITLFFALIWHIHGEQHRETTMKETTSARIYDWGGSESGKERVLKNI